MIFDYICSMSKVGRPPKFESIEDFNKQDDGFFDWCDDNKFVPDIEGLAVYLDTSRKVILDYEKKDEFSYTIKKIKDKIFFYKKQLAFKGKLNATVFIFDAKNNHEYADKQEIEHSGTSINITIDKKAKKGINYTLGESNKETEPNSSST